MGKIIWVVLSEEMLLSQHQSGGCVLCRWLARWSSRCKGPRAEGAFRIPGKERNALHESVITEPVITGVGSSSKRLWEKWLSSTFSFLSLFWVHLLPTTSAQVRWAVIPIPGKHSQKECLESFSDSEYYYIFFPTIFKIDKNPHLFNDMLSGGAGILLSGKHRNKPWELSCWCRNWRKHIFGWNRTTQVTF